jgi:4-amino-4-deoxy-L-arabinose transferase-like glycosyltransferase
MLRLDRWLLQSLRDRSRRVWLWIALGLILRLLLIWFPRLTDDDTSDYLELGRNLLHHGIYGLGSGDDVAPTLFRLPAYPVILAIFESLFARLWPTSWITVLLVVQAIADIVSGLLIASFVRRQISDRAGEIALVLAMLCPFTAAHAGIALTESFSVFALALGIYATGRALAEISEGKRTLPMLLLAGLASAFAMLLRPDGCLEFAALAFGVLWYGSRARSIRHGISSAAIYCCATLAFMLPWVIRNWVQFHIFQPLAPRYLNDPGERANTGFYLWLRTWSIEFSTTADVFWNVGSEPIDEDSIPARAFDSADQPNRTLALIDEYNQNHSISADLDNRFATLAHERYRNHPIQTLLVVPALRVADMLLRPRTLEFNLDVYWWDWNSHPGETIAAVILGLINLFYVAAALWGFVRGRVPFAWMLGGYLVLRCLLLATMENAEPRYTIQMFPIFIVAAAAAFAGKNPTAPLRATLSHRAMRQSTSGTLPYAH